MSLKHDLFFFIKGENRDNFSFLLFRLIAKADFQNLERLRLAFPVEVWMFEKWQNSENGEIPDPEDYNSRETSIRNTKIRFDEKSDDLS